MRRVGSPAHASVSKFHTGVSRAETSSSTDESALSGSTTCELGPGSPPKSREEEVLRGVSVCHAIAGPWFDEQLEQPPTYSKGGDDGLNGDASERESRSLLTGAAVYENEL